MINSAFCKNSKGKTVLISFCVILMMAFFCLLSAKASAEYNYPSAGATVETYGPSGTCKWELYTDGTLVISPTQGNEGTLGTWTYRNAPWNSVMNSIKHVKFNGTIHALTGLSFFQDAKLVDYDFTGFDTSAVEDMQYMFGNLDCPLEYLDVSSLDFSSLKNANSMFCWSWTHLKGVTFGDKNAPNLENMERMFNNCQKLESVNISGFQSNKITTMDNMFGEDYKLTDVQIGPIDTSNATGMYAIFANCYGLQEVDLSFLNSSGARRTGETLRGCSSIRKIILGPNTVLHEEDLYSPSETGKWIRTDMAYALTSAELEAQYYGPNMQGVWEWGEPVVFILMDAFGEPYQCGRNVVPCTSPYQPTTSVSHPGYEIKYWEDNNGNRYGPNDVIPGGTYPYNTEVTLTAYWQKIPSIRYAVTLYGIGADFVLNEFGEEELGGLTFGPVLGVDVTNSYVSHIPSGQTVNGSDHRCIHNDSWETIAFWSKADPFVYEQCIGKISEPGTGCTHAVEISLSDKLLGNGCNGLMSGTALRNNGDGISDIFYEITGSQVTTHGLNSQMKWLHFGADFDAEGNMQASPSNAGGWKESNVRAVLNGATFDTRQTFAAAKENLTENESLFGGFPDELKSAIRPKAVLTRTTYNDPNSIAKTYDNLWLFSAGELKLKQGYASFPTDEGSQYSKIDVEMEYGYDGTKNSDNWVAYSWSSDVSSRTTSFWTRTIPDNTDSYAIYVSMAAYQRYYSNPDGLAPGFVLKGIGTAWYTINYTANVPTATEMATSHPYIANPFTLPANGFQAPGYRFDHWELVQADPEAIPITFPDRGVIPASTFAEGETVTMKAIMVPYTPTTEMVDGEFEITLMAGEQAIIPNLPAGISYQIYEETPSGWVLIQAENDSGKIESLQRAEASFRNRYEPGKISVSISASKIFDGTAAPSGAFKFNLYENNVLLETVENKDGGFIQFRTFTYGSEGTHTYTIEEVQGYVGNNIQVDPAAIDFDNHTEVVRVEVTKDNDSNLHANVIYDEDGAVFRNRQRTGTLNVVKEAIGMTEANKDSEFNFKVTLTSPDGTVIQGEDYRWYTERY